MPDREELVRDGFLLLAVAIIYFLIILPHPRTQSLLSAISCPLVSNWQSATVYYISEPLTVDSIQGSSPVEIDTGFHADTIYCSTGNPASSSPRIRVPLRHSYPNLVPFF